MFADNNRIIDNDADGHDQRKQRQHVDGHVEIQHHPERRHQRGRNAGRHPKGDAPVQEQEQDAQHQHHAAEAVDQKHIDAFDDFVGIDVEHDDIQRRRQRRTHLIEIGAHRGGDVQRIAGLGALHGQADGPLAAGEPFRCAGVKGFTHGSDIADGDLPAVGTAAQHDGLDIGRCLRQADGAHLPLHLAAQHAARHIKRRTGDAVGNVLRCQIIAAQLRRLCLDPNFFIAIAVQYHLIDAGIQKPVADILGIAAQRPLVERAGHQHRDNRFEKRFLRNDRLFRLLRQRRQPVDRCLDIADGTLHVGVGIKLHRHRGIAVARGGVEFLHPVNEADFRLHGGDNVLVDILCRRPRPGNADVDDLDVGGREKLHIEIGQAERAHHDHRDKQQIGGVAVPREQLNNGAHRPHLRLLHHFHSDARRCLI